MLYGNFLNTCLIISFGINRKICCKFTAYTIVMSDFWIYVQTGLHHVLDLNGYDHVLFLIALTVPYTFADWKKILILVSVFTLGHTAAMLMSVFGIITLDEGIVEFLIPVTILITAMYTLLNAGKIAKLKQSTSIVITGFFGLIHGLGFAGYFKSILPGSPSDKLLPLLEFALGIEIAQIIVVLAMLVLAYLVQSSRRFSQRDWTLILSAFVIGVVVPMIIDNPIWK